MLIQILQELYDGGADYVDISGDTDVDGVPRDTIKITVKPEYLSDFDEESGVSLEQELDLDWTEEEDRSGLSDEDINDLIDSISLFADVNDLVGLSDCPASADRRRSLMLRRPEHPVDSTSFRRESMQVQENKWSMMDDDIRKKQQRRVSRFL